MTDDAFQSETTQRWSRHASGGGGGGAIRFGVLSGALERGGKADMTLQNIDYDSEADTCSLEDAGTTKKIYDALSAAPFAGLATATKVIYMRMGGRNILVGWVCS